MDVVIVIKKFENFDDTDGHGLEECVGFLADRIYNLEKKNNESN